MEITKPISPNEIDTQRFSQYRLNEAIQFLNQKISNRDWHNQWVSETDERNNYNAIILSPVSYFTSAMDEAVKMFKEAGWDCYWSSAYDARGPHECFYVNKNHFPCQ